MRWTFTVEQQRELAKAISRATMWHRGVGVIVAEEMDRSFDHSRIRALLVDVENEVNYEVRGTLSDETTEDARLQSLLSFGYRLCNYRPGELQIHAPSRQGGGISSCPGYVIGPWADRLAPYHDAHNFAVHQFRASGRVVGPL